MTRLVVRDASYQYPGGVQALRAVSMDAAGASLVAILGPNGSGKSTLLRIAAGLLPPHPGQATLDEVDLTTMPRGVRARRVAFLPQSVRPTYRHRVREVVALGRHPHRRGVIARWTADDQRAVERSLSATGTDGLAERSFDELSGGERQRVLLASLLAQDGDVLLLDEPTTALDLHHQVRLMRLLRDLRGQGRVVVCTTHDLNLAAAFADRVILLDQGQVRAAGRPEEVLTAQTLGDVYGDAIWVGPHPAHDGVAVLPQNHGPAGD